MMPLLAQASVSIGSYPFPLVSVSYSFARKGERDRVLPTSAVVTDILAARWQSVDELCIELAGNLRIEKTQ
jgi:hypothetical protein